MAYYLVKANAHNLDELRDRLNSGEIGAMRPFGGSLYHGLDNARVADDGVIVWEEEDYCTPPLAMERRAVLDTYFTDLTVELVDEGEGWAQIDDLPRLWEEAKE
jgi:hypothetical protein